MTARPWVLALDEVRPDQVDEVGGKAAGLAALRAAGASTPPAFVVTTGGFEAWASAPEVEAARQALGLAGPPATADQAEAVALARCPPLPAELRDQVEHALATLGAPGPYAVRSSGTLEDTAGRSFAGLYRTFLEVPAEEVPARVAEAFASLFAPEVVAYLRRGPRPEVAPRVAVLVQQMVAPEHAGVLFTVDPRTGREQTALVELVPGLGDQLVDGRVEPCRLVLDRDQGVVDQEWTDAVPEAARGGLRQRLVEDLLPLADAVAEEAGRPLDIEFALDPAGVHLLQARPITALGFDPALGEWSNADFNEGGVSAGPCSPLMWSLYQLIWERRLPEYFRAIGLLGEGEDPGPWGQVFYAVPYWNVGAVKQLLERVPGFSEVNFDEDLGIQQRYDPAPRSTPVTLRTLWHGLGVMRRMYAEFARQEEATTQLLAAFPSRLQPLLAQDVAAMDDGAFAAAYRALILEHYVEVEGAYFLTIFNSSNAKLEFRSSYDALAARAPDAPAYLDLMTGMASLKTVGAARELHALCARLRAQPGVAEAFLAADPGDLAARLEAGDRGAALDEVRDYLDAHAHHSRRELDLRVPRWHEEPAYVLGLVQQALATFDPDRDPEAVAARQHQRYLDARDRASQQFGWNWPGWLWFLRGLHRSRAFCWLREEARDCSTRLYRVIRRDTLEAGRRLVSRGALADVDDVFLLPYPRILAALEGQATPAEVAAEVEAHRRRLRRFRNFAAPNELGSRVRPRPPPDPDAEVLHGVAGAPGCVQGRVRVVRDLAAAGQLQRGDVLVTEFTDPGWTPLLEVVGAVVTEVGGVLSHAAVISRESGIPAVLSARGATQVLVDGQRVEVDGSRGEVRVLPE